MENYTLMYIDDSSDDTNRFVRNLSSEFEIKTIDLTNHTINSLMEILDVKDFDYLIVDYTLNERLNCGFNGDEVLVNFSNKFPHFPIMLLTNFDHRAIVSIKDIDTEKIHNKKEYTDDELKDGFVKRIQGKITDYKQKNEHAEARIAELIQKKAAGTALDIIEEEEWLKLDSFLDESLAGDVARIPDQLLERTNESRLVALLEKTDALINKLEEYETVQK